MNFTGEIGRRRVALGGRSRTEETREQILERTRQEREGRKRAKLEQQSASVLQRCWRRWWYERQALAALRSDWVAAYGEQGERLTRSDLRWDQPCLPSLLLVSKCSLMAASSQARRGTELAILMSDVRRLAASCRVLLEVAQQPGGLQALLPAAPAAQGRPAQQQEQEARALTAMDADGQAGLQLQQGLQAAAASVSAVTSLVCRLARLAGQCLAALGVLASQQRLETQQVLSTFRPDASLLQQPHALAPAAALTEVLLLLAAPDSWAWLPGVSSNLNRAPAAPGAPAGAWSASAAAAAVASYLVLGSATAPMLGVLPQTHPTSPSSSSLSSAAARTRVGLFRTLGHLLCITQPAQGCSRPYAGLLVTQLCVRALALKQASGGMLVEQLQARQPSQGVQLLLCVPSLWTRCPSLEPVTRHLTRLSAAAVAAIPPALLARQPHSFLLGTADGAVHGVVGSAAALITNLLEGGVKVVNSLPSSAWGSSDRKPATSNHAAALHLTTALASLLCVLPTRLLRATRGTPTRHGTDDEEEAEEKLAELEAAMYRSQTRHTSASATPAGAAQIQGSAQQHQHQQHQGVFGAQHSAGSSVAAAGAGVGLVPRLALDAEEMLPAELPSRLQQALTGAPARHLLWLLVAALLPFNTSPPATPHVAAELMPGALQLCRLLSQLAYLHTNRLHLYVTVGLSMEFVPRLWFTALSPYFSTVSNGARNPSPSHAATARSAATVGAGQASVLAGALSPVEELAALQLLCAVFSAHMAVVDVDEFYAGQPLPLSQLYDAAKPSTGLVAILKDRLWALLWQGSSTAPANPSSSSRTTNALQPALFGQQQSQQQQQQQQQQLQAELSAAQRQAFLLAAGGLYGALYDLSSGDRGAGRRAFCPPTAFHASSLGPDRFAQEAVAARITTEDLMMEVEEGQPAAAGSGARAGRRPASRTDLGARIWQVLRYAPALVAFEERARLFQAEAEAARREHYESEMWSMQQAAITGQFQPNRFLSIRRSQLLSDAFDKISALGPEALKGRVRVTFIDDEGMAEAGVDGGGLFKDFLEATIKEGFGKDSGLFAANSEQELYPNPAAPRLGPEALQLLTFLGRMLGKALWEGILVELPLARFFLKKLRGARCDLRDLASLDQQLYRNLLSLKSHKAQLAELHLTFTCAREVFGSHEEVELKPGGSQLEVTADNVGEYISRVADFRLNVEPGPACAAFMQGFRDLVRPEWVGLFNEAELQMLISGRMEVGLDLTDLRHHTHYAGGYHEDHPVVHVLWQALHSFTAEEQHAFLKFVTACSRAPLLGFKYLEPNLSIQMAGHVGDHKAAQRLPTAATCVNLLKLPPYESVEVMRAKLLQAITGAQTFDLS